MRFDEEGYGIHTHTHSHDVSAHAPAHLHIKRLTHNRQHAYTDMYRCKCRHLFQIATQIVYICTHAHTCAYTLACTPGYT